MSVGSDRVEDFPAPLSWRRFRRRQWLRL